MQVELVDFVSVPTRDAGRAVAWYREVLGLPESEFTEGEVEAPNVTFSFWEPERDSLPFVANAWESQAPTDTACHMGECSRMSPDARRLVLNAGTRAAWRPTPRARHGR